MSTSRNRAASRSTPVPAAAPNAARREDPVDRSPERRAAVRATPTGRPRGPEWTTQRWRLQVEAEARRRLKKSIQGLGSER